MRFGGLLERTFCLVAIVVCAVMLLSTRRPVGRDIPPQEAQSVYGAACGHQSSNSTLFCSFQNGSCTGCGCVTTADFGSQSDPLMSYTATNACCQGNGPAWTASTCTSSG